MRHRAPNHKSWPHIMCIELAITYGCGHRSYDVVDCESKKCKHERRIPMRDKDDCRDCVRKTMKRLHKERDKAEKTVETLQERKKAWQDNVPATRAAALQEYRQSLRIGIIGKLTCTHKKIWHWSLERGSDQRYTQEIKTNIGVPCPTCVARQDQRLRARPDLDHRRA